MFDLRVASVEIVCFNCMMLVLDLIITRNDECDRARSSSEGLTRWRLITIVVPSGVVDLLM